MVGLRSVRDFCGRRSLRSWPLHEVKNGTNVKNRKVGISEWKIDELKQKCFPLSFLYISFAASHIRVPPAPASRLKITE